MESKFIQIQNDWINLDDAKWIVDDPENDFLQIYFSDTDAPTPKVLRGGEREAFINYMQNHSYYLPVVDAEPKQGIPVIILTNICDAISNDASAHLRSAEIMAPLTAEFIVAMNSVIRFISDPEVRDFALREIEGVPYGSDNK